MVYPADGSAKGVIINIMEQIVIHQISPSDYLAIQGFVSTLFPSYKEADIQEMRKNIEIQNGFVALENSKYLGFILYELLTTSQGKITWLGTPVEDLSQGVAPILLKRLERELRKKGIQILKAETKSDAVISETDLFLRQFYRLQGYRDKEIKPFYYPDGSEGLILEKNIF
jgi:ribosomal protein S18 acetylase RimI-like enzyme